MEADPEYELAEDALHSPALRGEPAVQCCSGSTTAGGQSGCKLQSQHSAAVFSTGQLEDHYEVGPVIGRGGFGRVYAGQSKKDGRPVAIKQIGLTRVTNWGQVEGMRVPLEVALLNAVRKLESVARLLDYFPRPDSHLLVLERSPGQLDLFDHLTEVGGLGEAAAREIFRQAVVAVQDCHAAGVTHRDIKDENLLLCPRTGRITLIDFGSGAFIQDLSSTEFEGTRVHCPPEWLTSQRYLYREAAVWSLGTLLYTVLSGDIPFTSARQVCTAQPRLPALQTVSPECAGLVRACLRLNPTERIRLADIPGHPWLSQPASGRRESRPGNSLESEDRLDSLICREREVCR